ncbi:iron-containing alcohol dehydrogenase [Patescibacteria group bacterium]|nr:iron-containing alcohol dehydrogenase [Patescibacteria group bacterium]
MKNCWKFATPRYLKSGNGISTKVFDYIKELGGRKVFVVLDPNLVQTNKLAKQLLSGFRKIDSEVFTKFGTNPTTNQVNNSVRKFKRFNPDIMTVIGGGSAIDLAKATILTALNEGIIEDYLGGKKGNMHFIPFIAIPTTCGTGSEASPYAVIADPKLKKKRGIEDYNFLPKLVLLDPSLVKSLDQTTLAATAIDALAHVCESFVSKKANEITKSSARGILLGLINNIEKATFTKNDDYLFAMLNAAFSSRLLYPRTGLTIAHALSHPLGAYTNIHHGSAVSFFIPESFKLNHPHNRTGFNEAFKLLGFTKSDNFYSWFEDFTRRSGVRNYIQTYLKNKDFPVEKIASDAMESSNIPSNPKPITQKDLVNVIDKSINYWRLK